MGVSMCLYVCVYFLYFVSPWQPSPVFLQDIFNFIQDYSKTYTEPTTIVLREHSNQTTPRDMLLYP